MEQGQSDKFVTYISHKLSLSDAEVISFGSWGGASTLGALTLKLNILDMEKINTLLDSQEETGQLFGDLAVEMGFLNESQIKNLLEIQKGSRRAEILQYLLLTERVSVEEYHQYISKVYSL
jgi:hypothetical protein